MELSLKDNIVEAWSKFDSSKKRVTQKLNVNKVAESLQTVD